MRLTLIITLLASGALVAGACSSDDAALSAGAPSGAAQDESTQADATGDTQSPDGPGQGDANAALSDTAVVTEADAGVTDPGDAATPPEADSPLTVDPADGGATGDGLGTETPDSGPTEDTWTETSGDATAPAECDEGTIANCEGGCTDASWLGDGWCDTPLDCAETDFDGGDCVTECGDGLCNGDETYMTCPDDCEAPIPPENHPCEPSATPGSVDAEVTECVCAQDAWCCTNTWDAFCIQLASDACGAQCDCAETACETDDDCGECYGDACIGLWSCVDALCVQDEAVVCEVDEDAGCLGAQCDPATGGCVTGPDDTLCDDGTACTLDSCDGDTGECVYVDSEICGDQHPCLLAGTPGTSDDAVEACTCALDPYCCNVEWDEACISGAQSECGLVCDCTQADPADLGCAEDADCAWCGDGACTGAFTCVDGACQASAPVVCDTTEDSACSKAQCNPETGACEMMTGDAFCDDGDPCTLDSCEADSGECVTTSIEGCGETHPCQPSESPVSNDGMVNSCVCEIEAACCESAWGDACVEIAETSCGLSCECADLDADLLACESDAECAFCDDGDLCNGAWTCVDELCVAQPAVVCDASGDTGCNVTMCNPESGACEHTVDASLCNDGDPCTDDVCATETGACTNEDNGSCGLNHPCVSAPFPTSIDPDVTECVCELDPYCCATAWDGLCVEKAEENCGEVCTCDDPEAPVACVEPADCDGCDDGDLCNGTWGCVDGLCATLDDAVTCDPSGDAGCLLNTCLPATGDCELTPTDTACDDGDSCTADSCDEGGACVNEAIAECTLNHPCAVSAFPESSDPGVTACVCEMDPWCCDNSWDSICVGEAENDCGAVCDCSDPEANVTCETDAECGWCSDDLCDAPWSCVEGQCVAGLAVICDASQDTECLTNGCVPETGACAMTTNAEACDDGDPCTMDSCNEAGVCVNEVMPGCEGVPPYECKGTSEPAAPGCDVVESYEGCCDPWGRVTWCQDGSTYCIACDENPSCGWDLDYSYYNCGSDGSGDPSGAAPIMCPAYAP